MIPEENVTGRAGGCVANTVAEVHCHSNRLLVFSHTNRRNERKCSVLTYHLWLCSLFLFLWSWEVRSRRYRLFRPVMNVKQTVATMIFSSLPSTNATDPLKIESHTAAAKLFATPGIDINALPSWSPFMRTTMPFTNAQPSFTSPFTPKLHHDTKKTHERGIGKMSKRSSGGGSRNDHSSPSETIDRPSHFCRAMISRSFRDQ